MGMGVSLLLVAAGAILVGAVNATAVFVIGMGMFSIFLFLTYYFAASLGYSPIKTGLAYLPMAAAGAQWFARTTRRLT